MTIEQVHYSRADRPPYSGAAWWTEWAIDGQFQARLADIDIVPSFLSLFSHLHLMTLSQ